MVYMAAQNLKRLDLGSFSVAALVLLLGASLYLFYLTAQNPERFDRFGPAMLALSGAELVLLLALILSNLLRLVRQYRNQATGSRLSVRLVVIFVLLSVAPVTVVYYFALDFLRRGVDNWFDVQVEQALRDALRLSQAALDEKMREQLKLTEEMANELAVVPDTQAAFVLYEMLESSGATELTLMTFSGRIIASSSLTPTNVVPNRPHESVLLQVRQGHSFVGLDPVSDDAIYVRVVVAVPHLNPTREPRVIQSLIRLSDRVNQLAESVQGVYSEYEQIVYLREPLKLSFLLTLSVVLLLSVFTAVWGAFYAAKRLVEPIRVLAIGTRLVSSGDYGKRLPLPSNDELGFLVRSFNEMTEKIARARDEVQQSQERTEAQRAYLEVLLEHLSSGVVTVDEKLNIGTANHAAEQILGMPLKSQGGMSLKAIQEKWPHITPLVELLAARVDPSRSDWREEVVLFGAQGRQILMCRGTVLPAVIDRGADFVIVFDDITALVQAQRDAAWGEVARRLAHEIKNPLTPIQLSAERLRHKYLRTMPEKDASVLDRATHTIIQQVGAMKEMVQAFSDYARAPRLHLANGNLNELVVEVLDLYEGHSRKVRILRDLDPELPQIEFDACRVRQLLHNLVKNAIEAGEGEAVIEVATRAVDNSGVASVELEVSDDGPGIPEDMLAHVFEPYTTTKSKGTGLGLAIVRKIVDEHGGAVRARNRPEGGVSIKIWFPCRSAGSRRPFQVPAPDPADSAPLSPQHQGGEKCGPG